MKLTKVDKIPERRVPKHSNKTILEEFLNMNTKIVKVERGEHDWKNAKSAQSCLINSIKCFGLPIAVKMREGEIYLINKSI